MRFAVGDAVVFDRNSLGPSWAGYVGRRAVVTGAWDLERDWHLFPYSIRFDDGSEVGAFEHELSTNPYAKADPLARGGSPRLTKEAR